MGASNPILAVADAGPLIHLSEIRQLSLLEVFDAVHIADTVWNETVSAGRVQASALTSIAKIARHMDDKDERTALKDAHGLHALQAGELAALQLCAALPCGILLTDDLAARDAARRLGVTPVGSLGIVVRAYYIQKIDIVEAEQAMQDLFRISSLFVTQAIVDLAIRQLRQNPSQP